MRLKSNRGSLSIATLIIGLVLAILSAVLIKTVQDKSKQSVYFNSLNDVVEVAQTGLNDAISRVATKSNTSAYSVALDPKSGYSNEIFTRTSPVNPVYYIVTTATKATRREVFSMRLHTYARISNISDYFLATTDPLGAQISEGIQVPLGKIYAPELEFNIGVSTPTAIYEAQYLNAVTPPTPWDAATKAAVSISNSPNNEPEQLDADLVLPQLSYTEIASYKALAGPHTSTNVFSGNIYPPGYEGHTSNRPGDIYPFHTTDNTHHIYYSDDPIYIGSSTIHGQVLFITPEDIHIQGPIRVSTGSFMPGAGFISSSTAHQAVLITRGNVVLDPVLSLGETLHLEALIIATNGTLQPVNYTDANFHNTLSLSIRGSLILQTLKTTPTLPSIFRVNRTYSYMDSLKTDPPPYLPAVAEIYYSLEENLGRSGL